MRETGSVSAGWRLHIQQAVPTRTTPKTWPSCHHTAASRQRRTGSLGLLQPHRQQVEEASTAPLSSRPLLHSSLSDQVAVAAGPSFSSACTWLRRRCVRHRWQARNTKWVPTRWPQDRTPVPRGGGLVVPNVVPPPSAAGPRPSLVADPTALVRTPPWPSHACHPPRVAWWAPPVSPGHLPGRCCARPGNTTEPARHATRHVTLHARSLPPHPAVSHAHASRMAGSRGAVTFAALLLLTGAQDSGASRGARWGGQLGISGSHWRVMCKKWAPSKNRRGGAAPWNLGSCIHGSRDGSCRHRVPARTEEGW